MIMMSRAERKNMIEFITKMGEFPGATLLYMTDAEIEHIYNKAYSMILEIAE